MVFCRATTLVARGWYGQKYTIIAVFFNPFPLRDFPYLTTFAGAEKVTPLHTYLHLKRHESRASNVASPKLLPLGNAYTSMAFHSLTRNSGSTKYRIAIGVMWLR